MKAGLRKPSVKKRIKARTTAKVKRKVRGAIDPTYGKKGMGYIKDPERAIKNKIYHELTVDPVELAKKGISSLESDAEYHSGEPNPGEIEEIDVQDDGFRLFPFMIISEIICLIVAIVKVARGNTSWPWLMGVFVSVILYFVFKKFDL